jgi:hypothetical protein
MKNTLGKKPHSTRKLHLDREAVRKLSADALMEAAGGYCTLPSGVQSWCAVCKASIRAGCCY